MVERVTLDMNAAVLNLTFNEPVALALTAVHFITLQSQVRRHEDAGQHTHIVTALHTASQSLDTAAR